MQEFSPAITVALTCNTSHFLYRCHVVLMCGEKARLLACPPLKAWKFCFHGDTRRAVLAAQSRPLKCESKASFKFSTNIQGFTKSDNSLWVFLWFNFSVYFLLAQAVLCVMKDI